MIYAELIRFERDEKGVRGAMILEGEAICLTLERPWLGNRRNVSCIPVGSYECERVLSSRFGWTFRVNDVPNRSDILFHTGNRIRDSKGCICVGRTLGRFKGEKAVLSSRGGFSDMMRKLKGVKSFQLTIFDWYAISLQEKSRL